MSIDLEAERNLEIHQGQTAGANFNIYFLAHTPLADMNKSYSQFGKGLGSSQLEGAVINVKQFDKDQRSKDTKQAFWQIELKMYDEKHQISNKPVKDRCRVGGTLKRAIVRVFSEESTNTTIVEVKPEGQEQWISCI